MAVYPGAIPSFDGFTASHTLAQDNHASQHNLEQGEIVQIATKIGTGASTPTANLSLIGTGAGTSAWGQVSLTAGVQGILPITSGGTGQDNLTALPLVAPIITGGGSWGGSPTIITPILNTPDVDDFSSATHDHTSSSEGGLLGANSVATSNIVDGGVTSGKLGVTIAARVWRSAAFIITGGGGAEKMNLDGESFNVGGYYANTPDYKFNVPVSGYYQVSVALGVSNAGLSEQCIVFIYVNGSAYASSKGYGTSASDDPAASVSTLLYANAGDYIEMYVDATANVDVAANSAASFMSIHFVGAA